MLRFSCNSSVVPTLSSPLSFSLPAAVNFCVWRSKSTALSSSSSGKQQKKDTVAAVSVDSADIVSLAATFKRLADLYASRNDNKTDHFRSANFARIAEKLLLVNRNVISNNNYKSNNKSNNKSNRSYKRGTSSPPPSSPTLTLSALQQHLALEPKSTLWERISSSLAAKKATSSSKTSRRSRSGSLEVELAALESDPRVKTVLFVSSVMGFGTRVAEALGALVATGRLNGGSPICDVQTLKKCLAEINMAKQCGKEIVLPVRPGSTTLSVADGTIERTLARLAHAHLTHTQVLGLQYHDSVSQRIPRSEIEERHEPILQRAAASCGADVAICGSYRRNKASCGDIDCILYNKKKRDSDDDDKQRSSNDRDNDSGAARTLPRFVDSLMKQEAYIVDAFASGRTKWNGLVSAPAAAASKFPSPSPVRRLDIRFVADADVPGCLLYFTGSAAHNVYMRQIAIEKGYLLNEYGLWHVGGKPTKKQAAAAALSNRATEKSSLKRVAGISSEADIFKALGMDFVEPKNRE